MDPTTAFAILAPIPEEHLHEGARVCTEKGKVAFGSRAWQVFQEVDRERGVQPVEVLIYPSHPLTGGRSKAIATWRALYIGSVNAKRGAHPDGMTYRPASTNKYETDNSGYWALFWEVGNLRSVGVAGAVKISSLKGLGKKKFYAPDFVPEGPLRIEYPWDAP